MRISCCFHPKHYPSVYRNDHSGNIDIINCRHLECRHRERFELTRCKFAEMVMTVIEMLGIASKLNCFAVVICLVTSVGYISGALVTYLLFHISHSILWAGEFSWYSDWLRAGRSGNRIPGGGAIFSHLSRPTLGPTQPPVQWVPCFPGVKGLRAAGA